MNIGALLQQILTAVKNDAIKTALPILNAFFQNISSNPSQMNIAAQLASLEVQLLAALPNLEAAVAKDVAALVQQEINTLAQQVGNAGAAATGAAAKSA